MNIYDGVSTVLRACKMRRDAKRAYLVMIHGDLFEPFGTHWVLNLRGRGSLECSMGQGSSRLHT